MKNYVHARLNPEEQRVLKELKKKTGETESSLVKRGLTLVYQKEVKKVQSALELAGDSVGKFSIKGFTDISRNHKKYLEKWGYGK